MSEVNRGKLGFYKPYQNKGSACFLEYSHERRAFNLTMMPEASKESGKAFDAEKRIFASLGEIDVGEILAVLHGRLEGLGKKEGDKFKGLYHENPKGHAVITLSPSTKSPGAYFFGLSTKRDNVSANYSVILYPGEIERLRLFLSHYGSFMFEDTYQPEPKA